MAMSYLRGLVSLRCSGITLFNDTSALIAYPHLVTS